MDDLSANLLGMIFAAESEGLIKIKNPGEGKGQGRAMLMDHINGSHWLNERLGVPLPAVRQKVVLAALNDFRRDLLDDPYRNPTTDPVAFAISQRIASVQAGDVL